MALERHYSVGNNAVIDKDWRVFIFENRLSLFFKCFLYDICCSFSKYQCTQLSNFLFLNEVI